MRKTHQPSAQYYYAHLDELLAGGRDISQVSQPLQIGNVVSGRQHKAPCVFVPLILHLRLAVVANHGLSCSVKRMEQRVLMKQEIKS